MYGHEYKSTMAWVSGASRTWNIAIHVSDQNCVHVCVHCVCVCVCVWVCVCLCVAIYVYNCTLQTQVLCQLTVYI